MEHKESRTGVKRNFFFLALLVACTLSIPFLISGDYYLSIYTDDLFYYLKIAQHFVAGDGTTFNGLVQTNGYQPLWQGVIILLTYLSHLTNVDEILLLTCAIYFLFLAYAVLLDKLMMQSRTAFYMAVMALNLMTFLQAALTGMEIALLLPLMLAYCIEASKPADRINYILLGFVGSVVVLTRLDAALFIAIHLSLLFYFHQLKLSRALRYGLGGLLFPIYLIANYLIYGTVMPISGVAKSVTHFDGALHWATFESLFEYGLETSLLNAFMIVAWAFVSLMVLFSKNVRGINNLVTISICAFVPVYFIATSIRSDWPIWRWYFYPLNLCFAYFCIILTWKDGFLSVLERGKSSRGIYILAFFLPYMISISLAGRIGWQLMERNSRHQDALLIREFVDANPGVYAMGDRAGLPAYLTNVPFIQLEGLVMDKEYIDNLKRYHDISSLLDHYKVKYYVVGDPKLSGSDKCFEVKEPSHSNGLSPQIRSKICWPVAAVLNAVEGRGIYIFRNPKM
ncbi:MAG TPA: hypothetical protein VFM18_15475 [Methanosarcina sp.]|nr:hypothetical protein [Methanosarcina sp.]